MNGVLGNEYSLKQFDDELIRFNFWQLSEEDFATEIIWVNDDLQHLFPLGLEMTDHGLLDWLQSRVIPRNRAHVTEILRTFGLRITNTKGIIDVCKGLSLNDSYWVVPSDFDGSFREYNLYENPFSEILSLVAYTGAGQGIQGFTTTPELTTDGTLPKAWRFLDGDGIYLYKGGTSGASNTGFEPYSEFYACQIGEAMGLNIAHYDLVDWKGILASRCKAFTSPDISYIPIGSIVKYGGLEPCLEYYKKISRDAYEQIRSMLVFDCLIYNQDRHFGNFGVLRDNHTGKVIGAAPIFDNGYSLFNFCSKEKFADPEAFAEYTSTLTPASTNGTFTQLCRNVMGDLQRQQLRRVLDFRFERSEQFPLPEQRMDTMERQVRQRVRELMNLTPIKTHQKGNKDLSL